MSANFQLTLPTTTPNLYSQHTSNAKDTKEEHAKVILIMWKEIAENLNLPTPFANDFYNSRGNAINIAEDFKNWCPQNQDDLKHLWPLDLSKKNSLICHQKSVCALH